MTHPILDLPDEDRYTDAAATGRFNGHVNLMRPDTLDEMRLVDHPRQRPQIRL